MKIRNGFVSNSSSSSFIIKKTKLSETQIKQIKNHIKAYKEFDMDHGYTIDKCDEWSISETTDLLIGSTSMDNFNMNKFFRFIGVDEKYIHGD